MFLAVVLWVAVAAAVRGRVASSAGTPLVDSVASRCPRASMATGLRFALSSRPGESAPVTLGVAGTAAVVAGLIGSLTFAVGYRDLVDDAARYGHNFDIDVDNGAAQVPDEAIGVLLSSPAVAAAELYTSTQVQVAGTTQVVAFSGHEPARGDPLDPVLLEGRQPVGDQEIALGGVTAHRLGLSVGDEITLADDGESATYTITGLVIPADIGGNDLVGQGAVVTAAGFDRLDADRAPSAALVRLDPDASPAARAELAESFGVDPTQPLQRPPAIVTMSRITFVPYALAILLAVLATIVLAASIYSSLRTREHQVAVLRSLGADRRWLIASAAWHAVVAALVPAALGAPIGVIAGRLGFRAYADHRGLVSTPVTPVLAGLGFVAALLVVAAVVALAAGRAARRTPPAVVLRTA
jgi:putative ABC transport system permease protein